MKSNKVIKTAVLFLLLGSLTNCQGNRTKVQFTWNNTGFENELGTKTNYETYNYDSLIVNSISNLRDDFLMGVDASMVLQVEEKGGIYFNKDGVEQEVFQIMALDGVNAFRTRIWNDPYNVRGEGYGGGEVDVERAIKMAKRAQAAGMKIIADLHYSDFWADPATQDIPRSWATSETVDALAKEVKDFTVSVLQKFKQAGVTVDAVQIGNEINNGMLFPVGKIDWGNVVNSFGTLSKLLKAGISGAKSVNKNIYTIIHLANGGNSEEFNVFFEQMKKNNVNYDIIGASYYPYYHGSLEQLQNNLDNVSVKFKKPIIVAEMSYGYTTQSNTYTANIYNTTFEDTGGFLTSLQGQATAIHDVIEVLSKVPQKNGLGIFYWEPAWLPVSGAGWATTASGRVTGSNGLATWSNQGLFSYTGKVLPSMGVFKKVRGAQIDIDEIPQRVRKSNISVNINLADNEEMPMTYPVETNLGAIRQMNVVWDENDLKLLKNVGQYVIKGRVAGNYDVTANVTVIENFIRDPGFENQGITDTIVAPWIIAEQTPAGEKVVKLDRKADTRTGTTDLNWYHSSKDFSFKIKQDITGLEAGKYTLSVYCMAVAKSERAHRKLQIYIKYNSGEIKTIELKDLVKGWGSKDTYYIKAEISGIDIVSSLIEVGIEIDAVAQAWGHLDDWSLTRE